MEWSEAYELDVIEFLNHLAYLKEKEAERERQIKEMRKNAGTKS